MTCLAPTRNQRLTDGVLWGIVIAYAIGSRIIPGFITPLLFPFALIHGARRYGWKTIAVFIVVTAIVSNILENSRILRNGRLGFLPRPDSLHYQSRLDMEGRRRILWRTILQLSRLVIHRLHLLPAFRAVPAEAWVGRPESSTTRNPLSPGDHTLPVDRSRVCPRLLVHVPQH